MSDSFERGMLLMWHISCFMNVIVGSQLPSDIFIREMKVVHKSYQAKVEGSMHTRK